MGGYRIISSDDHVMEPKDLWTNGIEPKFRDRAPHVVRVDGVDWWYCDGIKGQSAGAATQLGKRFEEPDKLSIPGIYEDVRPGGYIPEEHLKDMDTDGVDVSIVYPTASISWFAVPDSDLVTAVFRAYNDWVADYCKPYPDRLKGIAMLNVDDVAESVTELERCAKMGLVGGMITVYPPEDISYDSSRYEPLWAAAQDLAMPLGLHIASNRPGPGQEFVTIDNVTSAFMTNVDHWIRMSLANMILSGVFVRYPKLQAGSIEMELSWVPHFLDRMDYNYTQRYRDFSRYRLKEEMLPSDYFHSNVFVSFQEDALGIRDRHIIGVDNLLWGSDYPHTESTFPRSREILEEILVDCTEEEKAKIVRGNAARIYNLS